jgi:phosphoglycolate phosphatase-like HAD superfamily hydrolase
VLILFDIDGTLLRSEGAGVQAMQDAAADLFGPSFSFQGIEIAGRLDVLIWRDACRRNGIPDPEPDHARFREQYAARLRQRLASGARVTLMPGVTALVEALRRRGSCTLGLLTGNYPETGRMKLAAGGLDPSLFTIGAWGCDGGSRRDLPPVAMRCHRERSGGELAPDQVIIIGDTPHDIDCARAHGCRSIGVATGSFSVEALIDSGADLAVSDLVDTPGLLNWMMNAPRRVPV